MTVAVPPPSEEELNPFSIFPKPEDNLKVHESLSLVSYSYDKKKHSFCFYVLLDF